MIALQRAAFSNWAGSTLKDVFKVASEFSTTGSSGIVKLVDEMPSLGLKEKKELAKIAGFSALELGWDGYDAEPPASSAVRSALEFAKTAFFEGLSVYFSAPGRNRDILVELKNGNREIEAYFNADGSPEVYLYNATELVDQSRSISIDKLKSHLFQ